jgi:hypothetical protein
MTAADQYRKVAAQLKARAASEPNKRLAAEWAHLSRCYLRLAAQADTNDLTDVWIETGARPRVSDI